MKFKIIFSDKEKRAYLKNMGFEIKPTELFFVDITGLKYTKEIEIAYCHDINSQYYKQYNILNLTARNRYDKVFKRLIKTKFKYFLLS